MDLQSLLDAIRPWPPALVYAALLLATLVEYVFPPFPGDTVVVVGAVLVGAYDWSLAPVFAAVLVGTVTGAALDMEIGRRLGRSPVERLSPRARATVDRLIAGFRRWGPMLLAVNRFLPGIRPLFFVAAGLAGMRTAPVLAWALVSATAWNALLVALGVALGRRLDVLADVLARYSAVAWTVVIVWLVGLTIAVIRGLR